MIRPLGDRVVIEVAEAETKTAAALSWLTLPRRSL